MSAITHQDIDAVQDALESIPTGLEEDRRNQRAIEALELARVVGVLDAWAVKASRAWELTRVTGKGVRCRLHDGVRMLAVHSGATPDAARAAAAKAIEAGEV